MKPTRPKMSIKNYAQLYDAWIRHREQQSRYWRKRRAVASLAKELGIDLRTPLANRKGVSL